MDNTPQDASNLVITIPGQRKVASPVASSAFHAFLSMIPVVGQPFQTALSEYLAALDSQRIERFLESVFERLNCVEIHAEKLSEQMKHDWLQRVATVRAGIQSSDDEKKLEYLRNYLVRCATSYTPDIAWKDIVLKYIQKCTGSHIHVLKIVTNIQGHLEEVDRFDVTQRTESVPITVDRLMQLMGNEYDHPLLDAVISDLESFGLLRHWVGDLRSPRGWSLTTNGKAFISFISDADLGKMGTLE